MHPVRNLTAVAEDNGYSQGIRGHSELSDGSIYRKRKVEKNLPVALFLISGIFYIRCFFLIFFMVKRKKTG